MNYGESSWKLIWGYNTIQKSLQHLKQNGRSTTSRGECGKGTKQSERLRNMAKHKWDKGSGCVLISLGAPPPPSEEKNFHVEQKTVDKGRKCTGNFTSVNRLSKKRERPPLFGCLSLRSIFQLRNHWTAHPFDHNQKRAKRRIWKRL